MVTLYGPPATPAWDGLRARRVDAPDAQRLDTVLPEKRALLFVHDRLPEDVAGRLGARHTLVGFTHAPLQGAEAAWLRHCALVVAPSRYCVEALRRSGVQRVYPAPVYPAGRRSGDSAAPIVKVPPYRWDRSKPREKVLAGLAPLKNVFSRLEEYRKRPGLTLGVVSALTPARRYAELFPHLAPILARHGVNLEIFGAGSYGHVRELKAALAPLGERARFWGHQKDVAAAYAGIDYLLASLPEGEALGVRVLEAQACGTPVLAAHAAPFTETVIRGHTGLLYPDPRGDGGAGFDALVGKLKGAPRPDPRRAVLHLSQFSQHALFERTRRLLQYISDIRIAA